MSRKKDKKPGYGKLLDAWIPPGGAGEPVGCVATSFTFSPVFFEEECLGRFLQLESDPTEDGAIYLVEREEKLAQVACAAVLVDQHHCKGARSLRWDLLPARVPNAILHAKVAIMRWQHRVRILVGSGNLTEDGYRKNQEIFGVLDYHENSAAPRSVLKHLVSFLRSAVSFSEAGSNHSSPAVTRWNDFLKGVAAVPATWSDQGSRRSGSRVEVLTCGARQEDAFSQLAAVWPGGKVKPDNSAIDRIALRVAAMMRHERVWAIDAPKRDERPIDLDGWAEAHGQTDLLRSEIVERYNRWYERERRYQTTESIEDNLVWLNDPRRLAEAHGRNLVGEFDLSEGTEYPGADALTGWYNRHLRIFANLQRVTPRNGERLLVVIDAAHVSLLRHSLEASPRYDLVEVKEFLGVPQGAERQVVPLL